MTHFQCLPGKKEVAQGGKADKAWAADRGRPKGPAAREVRALAVNDYCEEELRLLANLNIQGQQTLPDSRDQQCRGCLP